MLVHTYNHWEGSPSISQILSNKSDFPQKFKDDFEEVTLFMVNAANELCRNMKSNLKFRFNLSIETYHLSILNHEINKNLDYISSRLNSDNLGDSIADFFGDLNFEEPERIKAAVLYLISRFAIDDSLANLKIDFNKIKEVGYLGYYYYLAESIPYLKDIVQILSTYVYHFWVIIDYDVISNRLSKVVLRKENLINPVKVSEKILTTCTISQITALGENLKANGLIDPETKIDHFLLIFFDERELDSSLLFMAKHYDDFRKRLKIRWISYTNLFAYLFMVMEAKGFIREKYWKSEVSKGYFIDKNRRLFKPQALSKIISDYQNESISIKHVKIIDDIIKRSIK